MDSLQGRARLTWAITLSLSVPPGAEANQFIIRAPLRALCVIILSLCVSTTAEDAESQIIKDNCDSKNAPLIFCLHRNICVGFRAQRASL